MTFEELKNALNEISVTKSTGFPGSQLCLFTTTCSAETMTQIKSFIAQDGNTCKITIGGTRLIKKCFCMSVDNWLYFVEEDSRVCLRRVSWDKVEFLDTDLIRIQEGGDPK